MDKSWVHCVKKIIVKEVKKDNGLKDLECCELDNENADEEAVETG